MSEQYIVSARKYRPDTFETLVGQDNIAKTLKNSILRGQLAHAYLFCGPRGVGKTSTARIFAKTINCLNPGPDMEPCGECESCQSFAEGRSYCIHELDAASNNGVEDIKALIDQVRIPPQVGKYSVYIIDEVHMLSQAAFNAFLKTLEEPPAYAIFILATTEKHKILPTILSRCQTYDFNRITVGDIVQNLRGIAAKEGVEIDDESLHVIAHKADGAMRDALTIFDQTIAFCGKKVSYGDVLKNLNVLDYEYSFSLVENFLSGDYKSALTTFDDILLKGFNALHFVGALSTHFRDLIVSKASVDALLELPDSLKHRYADQAAKCSLKFLYQALDTTMKCESGYRGSLNPRLHIELALMRLCFMNQAPSAQTVLPQSAPLPQSSSPQRPSPAQAGAAPAQPAPQPVPPQHQEPGPEPAQAPAQQPQQSAGPAGTPAAATPEATPAAAKPAATPAAATPAATSEAATPATTPAATPEPSPAPRRRSVKAAGALSMAALKSSANTPKVQETATAKPESAELPQDGFLMGKWPELVSLYSEKPRLYNTLGASKLKVVSEDDRKTLFFNVSNQAQKDWVETKLLHELEGNFRKIVGDARVYLRVDLIPEEERVKVAYMPTEKAKELIANNEEVRKIVKDFDLDVK